MNFVGIRMKVIFFFIMGHNPSECFVFLLASICQIYILLMMIALSDKLCKNLFKLFSHSLKDVFFFESIKMICIIYSIFIVTDNKHSFLWSILANSIGYPEVLSIWLLLANIFLILVPQVHAISMFFCFLYKRVFNKYIPSKNSIFSNKYLHCFWAFNIFWLNCPKIYVWILVYLE